MSGNVKPVDDVGYIKYYASDSLRVDPALFTQEDLFSLNADVGVSAGLTGGAYVTPSNGCNIDFGSFLNIDFNISADMFGFGGSGFDTSMFDKADALSLEFAAINNMLINSILDMNCCDIAKTYNVTMVPFFQFFAEDGGFMELLIKYAEIITALRAIVEPLECLIRFVPGNPWLPKDFDFLAWIYGYFKESKPFLDRILSGEMIDIILNPVHNTRVKMQACLQGGLTDQAAYERFYELGSPAQLQAISALAASDGNIVLDSEVPIGEEPKVPLVSDYPGGAESQGYQEALKLYNLQKQRYDLAVKAKADLETELGRQRAAGQVINQQVAVTTQTQSLLRVSTNGICGCVADALGLNNISIIDVPVRTTSEMYDSLVGKTINNLTNKEAGTVTLYRPADEKVTVEESDIQNPSTKKKIIDADNGAKTVRVSESEDATHTLINEYIQINPGAVKTIKAEVKEYKTVVKKLMASDAVQQNDDAEEEILKLYHEVENLSRQIDNTQTVYYNEWAKTKEEIKAKIEASQRALVTLKDSLGSSAYENLTYKRKVEELEVATAIYSSYFSTFISFDFQNDPKDMQAIRNYISDEDLEYFFSADYYRAGDELLQLQKASLSPTELAIPFPPNTPAENMISRLDLSTDVDVDERFYVNYYNAGFVKEKGSSSWRNFNRLDLTFDEGVNYGAIGRDKTTIVYGAIFPSDAVGNQACIDYSRANYSTRTTLEEYLEGELNNTSEENIQDVLNTLNQNYGYNWETFIDTFQDDELLNIIMEISENNGYSTGKLWVKTRPADASSYFGTEEEIPEYTYTKEGDEDFTISANNQELNVDVLSTYAYGGVAREVQLLTNMSITSRGERYESIAANEIAKQALFAGIDTVRSNILNSVGAMLQTEHELLIPCTCDNILCMILNSIIQYVLGALQRLIDELINMIIQFLIPDWVKDLIRMIQDFVSCILSIVSIGNTISEISNYAEDLLASLQGRIRYYPADACYVPDAIEPLELPVGTEDSGGDDNDLGDDDGFIDGPGTYIPGTDWPPTEEPGKWDPPIISFPPVDPLPGDPGRGKPAFKLQCQYLEL